MVGTEAGTGSGGRFVMSEEDRLNSAACSVPVVVGPSRHSLLRVHNQPSSLWVTAEELRARVRGGLRGSKTPDTVVFVDSLPYSDLGKLSRRAVAQLVEQTSHTVN